MSTRKNQNSILALATLGVYLGLLMAGGTSPQVFAHSATTRTFEITDEIEIKDDLDKKPSRLDQSTFAEEIASLISKLNSYVREEKFSWNGKFEFSIEDLSFSKDGHPSFLGSGALESPEGLFFESSALASARSLIREKVKVSAGEKYSRWPETLDLKFHSDGITVRYDISIGTTDNAGAKRLHSALAEYLKVTAKSSRSAAVRLIAEKTTSEVDDVKVILVTHLPRAGLDSLLAKDAK